MSLQLTKVPHSILAWALSMVIVPMHVTMNTHKKKSQSNETDLFIVLFYWHLTKQSFGKDKICYLVYKSNNLCILKRHLNIQKGSRAQDGFPWRNHRNSANIPREVMLHSTRYPCMRPPYKVCWLVSILNFIIQFYASTRLF